MAAGCLNVELHCHTVASMDGLMTFDSLVQTARRVGLDALAITDHDTIQGATEFEQQARARQLPLRIIIGEEKTLDDGTHFIGLFLKQPIQSGDLAQHGRRDRQKVLRPIHLDGNGCMRGVGVWHGGAGRRPR